MRITIQFFQERAARADLAVFDRLLDRAGGEPPRPGDEIDADTRRTIRMHTTRASRPPRQGRRQRGKKVVVRK